MRTTGRLVLREGVALAGDDLAAVPFDALVVEDGRIAALGGPVAERAGDRVVNLEGAHVLPGLVDAHVHLDLTAEIVPYVHWRRPAAVRGATLVRTGLMALAHGITGVRDLGCVDDAVIEYGRLTAAGRLLGPRVLACGRWICMTGGHGWEYGREADGPDEVRRAAREQVRARAGVIKLMATGGLSTPGSADAVELTVDELRAGVEEAHHAGLTAAAHAHAPAGIEAAVLAGVDTVEHAAFADDKQVQLMKAHGVVLVPTLAALDNVRAGSGIDHEVVSKSEAARETFHRNVGRAIRAGVTVGAGTDAGTALNPVGLLVDELGHYLRLGMTETDALRSATVVGGSLIGPEVGRISEGWHADLLVVRRDPRQDLRALRRPELVIARGTLVDPAWARGVIAALGSEHSDRLLDLEPEDGEEC
jgi:imidazolonepropionase-like amidohydrolase